MISNKSWELEGCNDRQKKNTWGNPKKNMEKNNQMRKPEKKKNTWENLKNHRKIAIKSQKLKKKRMRKPEES